jgi:hypothetical protein
MALRTVSNTGGNWNATTTWTGGVVPIAGDTVDFTATSGPVTVNVATANLAGINFTNYVNTITFTNSILTSGVVNLGTGGYTQAGAGGLNIIGTATLTSNGVVWSRSLTFSGTSITYTLADNWTVSGGVFLSGTTSSVINSNTLNISGNLTVTSSTTVSGTTTFVFNGTGTWSHTASGNISKNIVINTLGTLTISGGVNYGTGTLTYTAGTVITAGSTLNIVGSPTLNTSGMGTTTNAWNNISFTSVNAVVTLTSNLYTANVITAGATNAIVTFNGAFSLNLSGSLTNVATITGTTTLALTGTGTINSTGVISLNTNINTSGTITVSGTFTFNTATLTYTAGTVIVTGSTLTLTGAGATLNTSGMTWNNVTFSGASPTYTFSSNLNLSGGLTLGGTSPLILTGNTINAGGNLAVSNNNSISGTTNIVLNGTGTWTGTGTYLQNNLTINTSGTITVSGTVPYRTGTLTYVAGTVITTGSTLLTNGSTTFNTSTVNWDNVTFATNSITATLTSNFNVTGVFTLSYTSTATVSFSVGANLFNLTGSLVANVGTNGVTLTLPNSITITNATLGNAAGTFTINSNSLNITGNLTVQSVISGTTTIVLAGTGTWSQNANGTLRNNTNINTLGTITISGNIAYNTGTLTYTAGTVITTGSNLVATLSVTLNTNGISWNNVTFSMFTGMVVTLTSDLTVLGTLTLSVPSASGDLPINGSTIYVSGNLTVSGNAASVYNATGTTNIVLNGTGTWSNSGNFLGLRINLTINTTGTITVLGTVGFNTKTLTYIAGTVDTSNATLYIFTASTTLNTGGIVWKNIFMQNVITITLLSDLNVDNFSAGYFSPANSNNPTTTTITFSGAYRLNVNNILNIGNGQYSLANQNSADSTLNLPNPITVNTLNVRLSGARNTSFTSVAYNALINNHSVTVLDTISIIVNDLASASISTTPIFGGTSELIMKGSTWVTTGSSLAGVLGTSGNAYNYVFPITINTGFLTISNNIILSPRFIYNTSYTFKHVAGTVKTTMPLQLGTGPTLINMQNIPWSDVFIASGITVTMNQFFGGSALKRTKVQATSTTNYNISFQDQFEKVCKFLEISNCTVSRRGQLLSLTDVRQKGTNLGIRYYNQSPNGVSKNGSLTQPSMTFDTGGLLPDPNCVKLN